MTKITQLELNNIYSCQFDEKLINAIDSNSIAIIQIRTENFLDSTDKFLDMLSKEEIALASQIKLEIIRSRYIIHRGVLRLLVSKIFNISPGHVKFKYEQYGKPALDVNNCSDLSFNLSHSLNWALYAFTLGSSVGIDVEEEQGNICLEELAPLFFSPRELQAFWSITQQTQRDAFYKFWTKKEAISKCLGMGMSMDFTQIDVGLNFDENLVKLQEYKNTFVFDISKKSLYFASLAVQTLRE